MKKLRTQQTNERPRGEQQLGMNETRRRPWMLTTGLSAGLLLVSSSASANILFNGGFESGSGTNADSWEELGAGPTSSVSRASLEPNSGSHYAYMEVDNTGSTAGAGVFVQQNQGANTIDNSATYRCSFFAKSDSTDYTGINMFVQIQWLDQDGSDGGGFKGQVEESLIGLGLTTDYQEFVLENLQPAEGSDSFLIRFQLAAGAIGGIDNGLLVDDVVLEEQVEELSSTIQRGTHLEWEPLEPESSFQVQSSPDNLVWTNLGDPIQGDAVTSAFDPVGAPFYRVIEMPGIVNNILNPGFEDTEAPTYPSPGAPEWQIFSPEDTDPADGTATMLVQSSYSSFAPNSGSQMLVIESTTPATGPVSPPNTDIRSGFNPIAPDTEYTVSFFAANVVKTGGANPQLSIRYFNGDLVPVGAPIFESFAGVGPTWTKVETTFTTPADAEWMTFGWIQAMGAGNGWQWVTLIDDVDMPIGEDTGAEDEILEATAQPGVGVTWNTQDGVSYQVERATDLTDFANFGPEFVGTGELLTLSDPISGGSMFYRVSEVTP